MAPVYALVPDQMAKGPWLKELVEKHVDFTGLCKGGAKVKALDYAAGTGWLSHVSLTPSLVSDRLTDSLGIGTLRHQNLAIDNAIDMVEAYNATAEETKPTTPPAK